MGRGGGRAVEQARQLIGVRFRPQGRSAELGLDCIGVAALTFGLPPMRVRADYRLRGGSRGEIEADLASFFDRIPPASAEPGDLVLAAPGPMQLHVAVLTPEGYLHADAGLRRVAEAPGALPWPVLSAWRFREREEC